MSSMTRGLAGALAVAAAALGWVVKPIVASALEAAGAAVVAGPTTAGAAAAAACGAAPMLAMLALTAPELLTVSALAEPAKLATRPPVAATTAAPFIAGWADSRARSLSSFRGL